MSVLPEFRNLIGGRLCQAANGAIMELINPTSGEAWALVPASGHDDVAQAVAAAAAAFPGWSGLPAAVRAYYLREVGKLFAPFADELSTIEMNSVGAIPMTSEGSVMGALGFIWDRAAGLTLPAVTGRSVPLDAGTMGYTRREPYGVVAAIIPFNAPLPMACSKISLAIAAGNTVVVKPPDQAAASILKFGEMIAQLLPPGVVNIVAGRGAEVGDPLVRHPDVRRITMTGSAQTARNIQRAAADNLTSSIFELGGKSPNIVFTDADLDKAAIGVTKAIFTANAGQACVGGSRILVHRAILDEMLKRMKAIVGRIVLGDPADPATTMGPLISQVQLDRVVKYIELGKKDAELVFGGRHGGSLVPARPNGFWVEPTLFLTADNSLAICQEEIFGPVAVVIPFDSDDDAIALANDSSFGLAAGLWTKNLSRINRFSRDLRTGNVWVNTYTETRYELPFSGIKNSGYGHDDILEFTVEKSVVIAD